MKTLLVRLLAACLALGSAAALRAEDPPAPTAEADYKLLGFENGLITQDGKPFTGVAIKKDKKGNKRGRFIYENGKLNGLVQEWYADGTRSVECTFVNDQRHGTNTYWNTDGTLMKRQIWKDGRLVDSTDKVDLENAGAK